MRRRDALVGMSAAAAQGQILPVAAQARVARIGILTPGETQLDRGTLLAALAGLGFREGHELAVDLRSAEGRLDRLPDLARDLRRLAPDLVVAVNSPATKAAIEAVPDRPIVAGIVGDPIANGFVTNLSRPGGLVTGVANLSREMTLKRLTLLLEAVPGIRKVAAFFHPDDPISGPQLRDLQPEAGRLGIGIAEIPLRSSADLRAAIDGLPAQGCDAVLRLFGQGFTLGPETGRLVLERRLPSVLLDRPSVVAGGLLSYTADYPELWRRVASQVAKILRGIPPGEIPVELPTKFEFLANLGAARLLGVALSPTLLAQADEVIE